MEPKDFIPSWLTSWVAWRKFYSINTNAPFEILKSQMGIDHMPNSAEFFVKHNNDCPFCHQDKIIKSQEFGLIYCLCKLLEKIEEIKEVHRTVKTKVQKAYLNNIIYPPEMGDDYIKDMTKAVNAAKEFIQRPEKWILLSGRVGSGKTHILKSINTAFDPIALYISSGNLEQLVHRFRKDDTLGDFYQILINAPILIIDDMGMEYGGPLIKSSLEKVIDARYEMYPEGLTVIATNLLPYEIIRYVPRAADRIMDRARSVRVAINSEKSFREVYPEMRQ